VKDSNRHAHLRVFKVAIKANGETEDAKILNMFSFLPLEILCMISETIIWEITHIVLL
jgi:hypothetical protein